MPDPILGILDFPGQRIATFRIEGERWLCNDPCMLLRHAEGRIDVDEGFTRLLAPTTGECVLLLFGFDPALTKTHDVGEGMLVAPDAGEEPLTPFRWQVTLIGEGA